MNKPKQKWVRDSREREREKSRARRTIDYIWHKQFLWISMHEISLIWVLSRKHGCRFGVSHSNYGMTSFSLSSGWSLDNFLRSLWQLLQGLTLRRCGWRSRLLIWQGFPMNLRLIFWRVGLPFSYCLSHEEKPPIDYHQHHVIEGE